MSGANEKDNILVHGHPKGTIDLQLHPEDVIEVPPEILALMNARLRGDQFADTYGAEDGISKDLLIHQERRKLERVFGSETEIAEAFSSLETIKEIRVELTFERINRALVSDYARKLTGGENMDEVDVYRTILFSKPVVRKYERIIARIPAVSKTTGDARGIFEILNPGYLGSHFEILGISKEILQLQEPLRRLMIDGKLLAGMDELLRVFYNECA